LSHLPDLQGTEPGKVDEGNGLVKSGLENIVIREVEYIHTLSERINALIASNEKVIRTYHRYLWSLGFFATFIRGVLMGFGWVVGTTIVVGVFVLFLHSFDSVPLVGEWVGRVMEYLESRH
jgi:hypothetical protein